MRIGKSLFILLLAAILPGCLADIRPSPLKSDSQSDSEVRGLEILEGVIKAHGGLKRWKEAKTMEFTARDNWEHWMGKMMFMPQEENKQLMRWQTDLGGDHVYIEMQDGPNAGEKWVMQGWPLYRAQSGNKPDYEEGKKIHFYVATMNYVAQLPFRSSRAGIVRHGGQGLLKGRQYDLVYTTWHTSEPQKDVNQYVLWIDPATHELAYIQLTDRELMKGASGFMGFSDWRVVDGLKIPFRITSYHNIEKETVLHELMIESVTLGAKLPREALASPTESIATIFGRRKTRD